VSEVNLMNQLKERMMSVYRAHYFQFKDSNKKYDIVKSSCARMIFIGLYEFYVDNNQCIPIEGIPQDLKNKYWDLSKEYFLDKKQRVEACTIMYVLDLMLDISFEKYLLDK
jgi:hypothetical protein